MRGSYLLTVCAVSWILIPAHQSRGETWKQCGFADFSQGSFSGAGQNIYVSSKGRIQLINRLDLNNDGHVDIVIPNGHAKTEAEDAFIYLNRSGDFDQRDRIDLPANGSEALAIADLDRDGTSDLIVAHADNGITSRLDAYIYYGGQEGFQVKRRGTLPAFGATSVATGDFNADGWIDLAFACENPSGDKVASTVYWNSGSGFDKAKAAHFSTHKLTRLLSIDWNSDGTVDLVGVAREAAHVFMGGKDGLTHFQEFPGGGEDIGAGDLDRDGRMDYAIIGRDAVEVGWGHGGKSSTLVNLNGAKALVMSDLDRDGLLDIAVAQSSDHGNEFTNSSIIWNSPDGLDKRPRTPLPTVAARCIAAGDLNGDDFPELVIGNGYAYNEADIQSFVYWNDRGRFYLGRKSMLDTRDVADVEIGDLDNDGAPDLAFANANGGWQAGWNPNFIYWGDGTRNYTVARRSEIPSYYTDGMAQADLDDDGWVDLAFSEGEIVASKPRTLEGIFLWWGAQAGFSPNRRSVLSAHIPEGGVKVADLNRDGFLDLIAGADDNNGEGENGFVVFWGSTHGYSAQRKQVFRAGGSRAPLVADLNADGYLDLACTPEDVNGLSIFWGSPQGFDSEKCDRLLSDRQSSYPEAADLNKDGFLDLIVPSRKIGAGTVGDSFVYYGSAEGFSDDRRIGLPTMAAYDPSVADLNKDGWLDLVMPNYSAKELGKRSIPTFVYWGSQTGFDPKSRLELPAHAGAGTLVTDFDGDGWLDLFIACHREDGSNDEPGKPNVHRTDSFIYWNGPQGLDALPPSRLPSVGPHVLMAVDVGNIMTRELAEYYTSPPYQTRNGASHVEKLSWRAETPGGTGIAFQLRSASSQEELLSADWRGPEGPSSWYETAGTTVSGIRGPWIQYRCRLSTPNGAMSPYLYEVSVHLQE